VKYYGFCTPAFTGPTEWGDGDVMGVLFYVGPHGPLQVKTHWCTSPNTTSACGTTLTG